MNPIIGRPGYGAEKLVQHRIVARQGFWKYLANGQIIDGSKSRDSLVSDPDDILTLRPGLLMGKITSGGRYAPSVIGTTSGALTSSGTSITVSAVAATEIVRRLGTTGTLTLTGPPTANGTVRSLTATYSNVNTTTGVVTITALGVNEVQTVNLVTAATGGSIRLIVQKTDGTFALTPAAAWSATDATLLSNLQTALDTATGVANGIVATAIAATDTDLGVVLTYSGTGYAGQSWALAQVHTLFTSNTGANVVRTTTGVDGRMIAGSLVGPVDGSQVPVSMIPDGYGIYLGTENKNIEWPNFPIEGDINFSQLLPCPTDTSLISWVRNSLSSTAGAKFTFANVF